MKFIHTADWQLGKPFARVEDAQKRSLLQQERVEVLARIGELVRETEAAFVLVAGDLFDSPSATKSTVSAACSAIGKMGVPVLVIPGNHDHGGPGSIWEQEFFQRERESLASNLRILLEETPVELDSAVIFPCPLNRRAESVDPTSWLRSPEVFSAADPRKPRIILAHGSTQAFTSQGDDEEGAGLVTNQIELARLPEEEFDYVALGDWHGTKQTGPKAWYSGTPELDRFPKGEEYQSGNVLVVEVARGGVPRVVPRRTAKIRWSALAFDFADDSGISGFEDRLANTLEQRTHQDLLQLHLTGSLGIEASSRLENLLESVEARVLRLKLVNETAIAPTEEEIHSLTERQTDPLIARVAQKLCGQAQASGDSAVLARIALRELHAAVVKGR